MDRKKYSYTLWAMALFFSWFLSFPYFGSVISNISESILIEEQQITLTFIAFHASGFLLSAIFLKNNLLWRKLIFSSLALIIPLNISLILIPPDLWLPVIALIGFFSSFYILGWSVVFSSISALEKIKLYALALIIANLAALAIDIISAYVSISTVIILLVAPLLASLILHIQRSSDLDPDPLPAKNKPGNFPLYFFILLFLIIFILHFSFGFMFALIDESFPVMQENRLALEYYRFIPYLLACLVIYKFASSVNLRYMPQLGISLFGLAFIFITIFNNKPFGIYLTSTLIELAVVTISVFVWVMQGELSRVYAAPYRFFGFGLFTTLLAVFFGNIFGIRMLQSDWTFLLTAAFHAVAAILITMVAVPWLLDKVSAAIITEVKMKYQDVAVLYEEAGLTEREKEIAELLFQGHVNRVMAERLFISENTLKTHLRNIYDKFNVNSKNALIAHLASKTAPQNEK